ncbi:unnamed protein product [Pedinophyceae sp. YPF-701]|nr:unnamed protein product [Pedinophyceae sp. YPF-701]
MTQGAMTRGADTLEAQLESLILSPDAVAQEPHRRSADVETGSNSPRGRREAGHGAATQQASARAHNGRRGAGACTVRVKLIVGDRVIPELVVVEDPRGAHRPVAARHNERVACPHRGCPFVGRGRNAAWLVCKHAREVHRVPFTCRRCFAGFRTKSQLLTHDETCASTHVPEMAPPATNRTVDRRHSRPAHVPPPPPPRRGVTVAAAAPATLQRVSPPPPRGAAPPPAASRVVDLSVPVPREHADRRGAPVRGAAQRERQWERPGPLELDEADRRVIVLFDVNGVMTHRSDKGGRNYHPRPGADRLLRMVRRVRDVARVGVYSSAMYKNVAKAIRKLEEAAGCARDELFDPVLVLTRSHAQLLPERVRREWGLKGWDTWKPLGDYFPTRLHRVVLVDDDVHKSLPTERGNLVLVPSWDGGEDDGVVGALTAALEETLLGLPEDADVRERTAAMQARLTGAAADAARVSLCL